MISDSTLHEYSDIFVQRLPLFGEKKDQWYTIHGALSDVSVRQHLEQKRIIGTLATYYPNYMVIDCDDVEPDELAMIRETLRLNESNSIVCSSFSTNSYHIYTRPVYKGNPATVNLLQKIMEPVSKLLGVEIFPCKNKVFRLPFGVNQKPIHEHVGIQNVQEFLYWFNKLDEYELSEVSEITSQELQNYSGSCNPLLTSEATWYREGQELLENGLVSSSSRHESQARVLYYFWRNNVCEEHAVDLTFSWILQKHNGFSSDIINTRRVKNEISRQAFSLYTHYEKNAIYPDSTHNAHNGWTSVSDIKLAAALASNSSRQLEFNLDLFAYLTPRQNRDRIRMHSTNVLRKFGRSYKSFIGRLEESQVVKRGSSYFPGARAKELKILDLKLSSVTDAIQLNSRNLDPIEAVRSSLRKDDLQSILLSVNFDYQKARRFVNKIY